MSILFAELVGLKGGVMPGEVARIIGTSMGTTLEEVVASGKRLDALWDAFSEELKRDLHTRVSDSILVFSTELAMIGSDPDGFGPYATAYTAALAKLLQGGWGLPPGNPSDPQAFARYLRKVPAIVHATLDGANLDRVENDLLPRMRKEIRQHGSDFSTGEIIMFLLSKTSDAAHEFHAAGEGMTFSAAFARLVLMGIESVEKAEKKREQNQHMN